MVTAPFNVTIRPRPAAPVRSSPYGVVMLIPQETGVVPAVNTITEITDATAAAQLGAATNLGRRWYDHIESKSNTHIGVIPFDAGTPATVETNGATALMALAQSSQRANLGFSPDILLIPNYPALAMTASGIISAAETVCQNPSVLCRAITDAFDPAGVATGTQAQVITWAGNNTGSHVLAVANNAPAPVTVEFGSVIVAAHICQDSAENGVGSHPFSLSHPISGIGTPAPIRVFDINDGSAEAEALAGQYVTSIIIYDGREYAWNGQLRTSAIGDPREHWGNAVISDRMVKRARQLLAPYYGGRTSAGVFADMADHVRLGLTPEFVGHDLVGSVNVLEPTLSGSTVTVEFEVGFHGYIEAIRLFADIFMQAL